MKPSVPALLLLAVVIGCSSSAEQQATLPESKPTETKRRASTRPESKSRKVTRIEATPPVKRVFEIRMLTWNIESGGNDPNVIAQQLRDLAGYDIYALQEVRRANAPIYAGVFGERYSFVMSSTGGADQLVIGFDTQKFEQLETRELTEHGDIRFADGRHRLPIYVRLRHKDSGRQIVVMTNHLARADAEIRRTQARGLREWARGKSEPIFAIGDFNFDYDFNKQNGNQAFQEFMRDGVWKWIRPEKFVDTQWSGDVKDRYPDSMLDFTFVAGAAKDFECENRVIVRDGDFPDDRSTSDHRPVELVVRLPN